MRDTLSIIFWLIASILGVFLLVHIVVCCEANVNWVTAPLFNSVSLTDGLRIMQVM